MTLSGTALSIASAESLEDGRDVTVRLAHENDGEPIVYADQLDVDDCADLLASLPR